MEPSKEMLFSDWDLDRIIHNLNPAREDEIGKIVTLLQDDQLDEAQNWLRVETSRYSWVMLAAAHLSVRQNLLEEAMHWLRAITLIATDTMVQLWAWHNLQKLGKHPPAELAKKVMGIIVEVPNGGGQDVLASYADGTVRFLSFSGAMILWEEYHEDITPLIYEGLKMARPLSQQVDHPSTGDLPDDEVRLTILTPGGMTTWQGVPEENSDLARLFARQAILLKILIQSALENRGRQ